MPVSEKTSIRVISYLDPVFEIEIIERSLREINILIESNKSQLEQYYKEETSKAKTQEEGSWIVDMCADEGFIIAELEKTFISSLAITLNSIFERHISLIIRDISSSNSTIIYNLSYTYSIKQLKPILRKIKHPNLAQLDKNLLDRLGIYSEIRNSLVHNDGSIKKDKSHLMPYLKNNPNLFDLNIDLWKVSLKPAYLEQSLKDIKIFFKQLIYLDNGKLIFNWADPGSS